MDKYEFLLSIICSQIVRYFRNVMEIESFTYCPNPENWNNRVLIFYSKVNPEHISMDQEVLRIILKEKYVVIEPIIKRCGEFSMIEGKVSYLAFLSLFK